MAVMMVGCSSDDDNNAHAPTAPNTLQIRNAEKSVIYQVTGGIFYGNETLYSEGPSMIFNFGLPEECGISGLVIRIFNTNINELHVGETFHLDQFEANLLPTGEWFCGTAFVNNTRFMNGAIQVVDNKTKGAQVVLTLRLINLTFGEDESSIIINGTVDYENTGYLF